MTPALSTIACAKDRSASAAARRASQISSVRKIKCRFQFTYSNYGKNETKWNGATQNNLQEIQWLQLYYL